MPTPKKTTTVDTKPTVPTRFQGYSPALTHILKEIFHVEDTGRPPMKAVTKCGLAPEAVGHSFLCPWICYLQARHAIGGSSVVRNLQTLNDMKG